MSFWERTTKRDRDSIDYKDGLRIVTSTKNCVPQVMVKTANGSGKHNVVKGQDADELLASGRVVAKNKTRLKENATTPTNSETKTFHDSPKPFLIE